LISTIPPIERVGTCLISVFVDILLLSLTSPALARHQGGTGARLVGVSGGGRTAVGRTHRRQNTSEADYYCLLNK
jgi:hypothetical protein